MITNNLSLPAKNFSYPIYVGENILTDTDLLKKHIHGHQVLIVTQETIAKYYLPSLRSALSQYQLDVMYLPDGEQYKNLIEWQRILNTLVANHHERSTTLIALGGGVIGDITGFAASCYQRGVNYLQIPTTLIAQVDAAIGGKTAVNHTQGKNIIGAFYQPQCVIADIATLTTLPLREYKAGLAEVIKYGLICDANFFFWLEENITSLLARDRTALLHVVATSTALKTNIVCQDEHDLGLRNILNFGHTFGHALEVLGDYQQLLHGEAVAIGMMLATAFSETVGMLTKQDAKRILNFLQELNFVNSDQLPSIDDILNCMWKDKKVQQGKLNLILLKGMGSAEKVPVSEETIRQVLASFYVTARVP